MDLGHEYFDFLHAEKYRQPNETFEKSLHRMLQIGELEDKAQKHFMFDILKNKRFMPAGRIQAACGAAKNVTPYNCFVSGTIPDSFTSRDNEHYSSIMHRAEQAATTMRMGGGIGYDFSTLRPKGALIKKLGSLSSGPLGFMPIFNEVCKATSSAGNRRGAQMGVLRIDHPDIFEFISAKHNSTELTGFNISLGITHEFMEALENNKPFNLKFKNEIYSTIDPLELWEKVMLSTWDWAEPGVLFIDTINDLNNLYYCEKIAATNPCGEQPLPPFGACLLGSFNLTAYLKKDSNNLYYLDFSQLEADIPYVVEFMNNVIDSATYPLAEQKKEALSKRRMGLGITGLANALEAQGFKYGSIGFLNQEKSILRFINRFAYLASINIAKRKGPFELFNKDKFLKSNFIKTLDDDIKELIGKYGIRNSHLTSIAPTGTISLTASNISSSIEPVYKWKQKRTVIGLKGKHEVELYDYGFSQLQVRGKRSYNSEISVDEHLGVLTVAQNCVDSAVSKTINCDNSTSFEDFKNIYLRAYKEGAKGCTTFNREGKRAGIFKDEHEPDNLPFPFYDNTKKELGAYVKPLINEEQCSWDPITGVRNCE